MTKLKNNHIGWQIENSYTQLPPILFTLQNPISVTNPQIVIFNDELATFIGLNPEYLNTKSGARYLSGNQLPDGSKPLAQGYAGHQYGYFTVLGDGRAILLGEQVSPTLEKYDIQLKGSGLTPYSRGGDGRATLSSMLREYIISEAMHALNIPTTRSLSVVTTGDFVPREKIHEGAILVRISKGHIRIGTFEFAARKNLTVLKELADYVISRFYESSLNHENKYLSLLEQVINNQAILIAKWQSIGFIHGVMNTDNMSIIGETIDYGPCAFMDTYDPNTVFSSIDSGGRYAYKNQPQIAQWNLARFAETLLPLLHQNETESIVLAENAIAKFNELYEKNWLKEMGAKIGILNATIDDTNLIEELLTQMKIHKQDFTNTFINLMNPNFKSPHESMNNWIDKWHNRLEQQIDWADALSIMQKVNPTIIPRNHQVEKVLQSVTENHDDNLLKEFLTHLSHPFDHSIDQGLYTLPPTKAETVYKTYCGT